MSTSYNKTLVVVLAQQLTDHTYKQFNCDLRYKNWKILFWNILPLFNYKLFKESLNIHSFKRKKNFIYIKSFFQLIKELKKIKKPFGYLNLLNSLTTSIIDILLKKKGGKKIYLYTDEFIPVKPNLFSGFKFYFNKDKYLSIKKFFLLFFVYLKKIFTNILTPKPQLFFIGNYLVYKNLLKKVNKKKIYRVNNHDYEKYLLNKKKKKQKYIVFIDQDYGEDFDYKLNKSFKEKINLKDYWNKLELLFKQIEFKYPNYKIKIAAHHRRNKFSFPLKRKFIFNKTLDLIKEAKLVIGSSSTAFSFAILAKKPILLISHESFFEYSYRRVIDLDFLKKVRFKYFKFK